MSNTVKFARSGKAKEDRQSAALLGPKLPVTLKDDFAGGVYRSDDWDSPQGQFRTAMNTGNLEAVKALLPEMLADSNWSEYNRSKWVYKTNILLENDGLPVLVLS